MEKVDPNIFRAYDIRGVYGQTLTPEIMMKIGMVIGSKHKGKNFVVGNDIRKSSPSLAHALIAGLLSTGGKVTYVGTTPMGETLFAGWRSKKDISLYITASHLPPEWNGLKPSYGEGLPFSSKDIEEIKEAVLREDFKMSRWDELKEMEFANFRKEYINYLISKFRIDKKLKVVLDCGNGSMCLVAPYLFKKMGMEVTEVFCNVDPTFPNRESEPKPENLNVLVEKVKEENADFGVAFDGDGDRAVMVDDKGRIITGNEIGLILAKSLLREEKGTVVATVACSMSTEKEIEKLGGKVIRIPVGHTFVIRACKEKNAILGMEESGHMVIPSYFLFDDAMIVPLKIAEILCNTGKKLSEIVDEIPKYSFREIVFKCSDEKKFRIVERLKQKFLEKYERVETIDGVKVLWDDGWILIRASNTSPKIRLYVEAVDEKRLDELKKEFSLLLEKEIGR